MNRAEHLDLLEWGETPADVGCDVCVIGGGAAGIYIAVRLALKGLDVIVVEAGGSPSQSAESLGMEARFPVEEYPGAKTGRVFGIGGTTTHWGGLLIPHTHHDIRSSADMSDATWAHIVRSAAVHGHAVLKTLGYRGAGQFDEFARAHLAGTASALRNVGLDVAATLFLPLRRRNLAFLLGTKFPPEARLRVIRNAVVSSWSVGSGGTSGARVCRVGAVARNGKNLGFTAQWFIISAGAIESARLLLELNSQASGAALQRTAAVGHYLADHLSVPIADVAPADVHDIVDLFAPRFSGAWMRSFRFVESNPPSAARRAFAHFIFDVETPGYALAKKLVRAVQERARPVITWSEAGMGMRGAFSLAFARYARSSLFVPIATPVHLQLDIEQVPRFDNRVSLGGSTDEYGRQVAEVHWRIGDTDRRNLWTTARRILGRWPGKEASLPNLLSRDASSSAAKPHDAYHPVGTCQMGSHPEAVVDHDLKVRGLANLWVVSTGVLPSAGTANPTFTMLCLGEGLVEKLTMRIKGSLTRE